MNKKGKNIPLLSEPGFSGLKDLLEKEKSLSFRN